MAVTATVPYSSATAAMTGSDVEVTIPASKTGVGRMTSVTIVATTNTMLQDNSGTDFLLLANVPVTFQDPNLGGKTVAFNAASGTVYLLYWFGLAS